MFGVAVRTVPALKKARSMLACDTAKEVAADPYTRMYPKVCKLASWSENCKWYSSLPVGAVVSLFCESVY
jgi:hypothetical protein